MQIHQLDGEEDDEDEDDEDEEDEDEDEEDEEDEDEDEEDNEKEEDDTKEEDERSKFTKSLPIPGSLNACAAIKKNKQDINNTKLHNEHFTNQTFINTNFN